MMPATNTALRSMLSVAEAEALIRESVPEPRVEGCPLSRAAGRLLAEEVRADRDFPPYDRITMDGVALSFEGLREGRTRFRVSGLQAAGAPAGRLGAPEECIEVATGAMLPDGCDCVLPIEQIVRRGEFVEISPDARPQRMQNVHRRGSDYPSGALLIPSRVRLFPPHVAVCAAVGRESLQVGRRPRIALVATGDELVEVGRPVAPHQVRISNIYAVEAALRCEGFGDTDRLYARDERSAVRDVLSRAVAEFDVVVISGGVSAGRLDLVPETLESLQVRALFHKVRQRPGLPFLFAVAPQGKAVFALPGNPVSTLVCAYRYLLPYLRAVEGAPSGPVERAALAEEVTVDHGLTLFLPVRLGRREGGDLIAHPRPVHGSGDFARLTESDGFLELREGQAHFPAGSAWPLYPWTMAARLAPASVGGAPA